MPSFIWRPSSREAPEHGATIPNRISRSVTPRAVLVTGCCGGAAGAVAAAAEEGAMTPDSVDAAPDGDEEPEMDCSRSASWRSATPQLIFPVVMAPRPSLT